MQSLYGARPPGLVRPGHPIFINKDCVDSVLVGPALSTWRSGDSCNPTVYVIVMNMRWWDHRDEEISCGQQANSNEEEDEEDEDEEEEHYPPNNGCQMYDVGWTKISVNQLYPRSYCLLSGNDLWRIVYKRPPKISVII